MVRRLKIAKIITENARDSPAADNEFEIAITSSVTYLKFLIITVF